MKITRRSLLALPATLIVQAQLQLVESQRVTFTGIGRVRIGMTERQVRAVLSGGLERTDFEEGCSYLSPETEGISFMLLKSRVARVDISSGHWLTASGAGIGTSEAEVHRIYARVRTEPHPYYDPGQGYYLRVRPADARLRNYELLFETAAGVVTSFRAGLTRAVALIEGCS